MKKFLYLAMCLLLVASLCLCFVACGDDEEPTDSSQEPSGTSSSSDVESKPDSQKPAQSTSSETDSSKPTDSSDIAGSTGESDTTESDSDSTDKSETTGSIDKPETPDSTDKSETADSTDKSETTGSTDKPETPDSTDKSETPDSTDKSDTVDSTGKSDVPGSTDSSDETTDSSDEPGIDGPPDTPNPPEEGHKHTYANVYSYDDKSHYYAATCEHKDEKTGVEDHTHDAETGDCVCGHHVHRYSNEYSFDTDNHFYKATCVHYDEVTGIEAHTFNENNECKCGRVKDDLAKMLEELIKNKGLITSGTSTQTNTNIIEGNEVVSGTKVTYFFYDNYVYVKDESDYINEFYYSYNDGKLIAIQIQNGGKPFVDSEASLENLEGARYGFACVGDYESYACGAERLVKYFYNRAVVDAPENYKITKNGNVYTLDYAYCAGGDWNYYYIINMVFSVDEATTTLASVNITIDRYAQDSYTVVDGVYILNEDAKFSYHTTYEVTQSLEANENVENPYDAGKILLDSITIKDKDGNDIESVTIKQRADEQIILFLSDIVPSTALLELCSIEIIVINEVDGTPVTINPEYLSYDNSYRFYVSAPGSYKLEIKINDMTFTTSLESAPMLPLSIGAQVYDFLLGEFNKTKRTEVYAGTELYFVSYVDANYDGAYVASIVGENAANATLTKGEIGGKEVTVFKSDVIDEYVIEIKSAYNEEVVAQLKVSVTEAPRIEDILSGKYFKKDEHGKEIINVEFDAYKDVAYITFMSPEFDYEPIDTIISYTIVDDKIEFTTDEDSEELLESIYVNDQLQLVVGILENEYVLEKLIVEAELVSSGTMTVKDLAEENSEEVEYAFELYSDGEFMFYVDYSRTRAVALTNKNGSYVLRRMGMGSVTLDKISGEEGSLAGEYEAKDNVNVVITVDSEATYVEEPTYGTIEVVDYASSNIESSHSFIYGYEIVDGDFVIYRYDVVTDTVKLVDLGGEYSFLYSGVLSAQMLEKIEGGDDVLGGKYIIEMNLATIVHIADVIITPGATAPSKPVVIEKPYGAVYIEDHDESGAYLTGTYYYEIVDGGFVVYKDGVVTTDFFITTNLDGTIAFQCEGMPLPQVLHKENGVEGGLEGTYIVPGEDNEDGQYAAFYVTFEPGVIEEEDNFGTLVIDDKNTGVLSGTYYYELTDGILVFFKEDGNIITNEFLVEYDLITEAYTFQSLDFVIRQPLVKVEGMGALLGGKYTVSGENGVVYELSFAPGVGEKPYAYVENGTLEIVDKNTEAVGGSYTYGITVDGEIHVFKDGERTSDVLISIGLGGNYTFQCPVLRLPMYLNKVKGETGMLSGKYFAYDGATVKYELLFLKEGYEMPAATNQALVEGENTVVVNDTADGIIVTYTNASAGEITITNLTEDKAIVAYLVTVGGETAYDMSKSLTISAGAKMTIRIKLASNTIDTVKLNLKFQVKIEMGEDEF